MASYWITVHWPHPAEDDHPWDVYFRKERAADGHPLAVGDKVFFYQTTTVYGERPTNVRRLFNGERREARLPPGAGAIVRLGEVVQPLADLPPGYVRYDCGDGGTAEWKKHVRCGHHETGQPVRAREIGSTVPELKKPVHTWRGLHRLRREEFAALLRRFRGNERGACLTRDSTHGLH
jgi:hypothetical protein